MSVVRCPLSVVRCLLSVVCCPLSVDRRSLLRSLNSYSSLHHHLLLVNNVDASLWSGEALACGVVDGGRCVVGMGGDAFDVGRVGEGNGECGGLREVTL